MRHVVVPLLLFLMLLFALPAQGAPPKPRPAAGSGLLVIRPPIRLETDAAGWLVLYQEPGIARIAEKKPEELPLLTQVIATTAGDCPAAVLEKRGNWVRVAYDDAGREGWLEMERHWEYLTWVEFFPGRTVRLLPGLKKEYGALRRGPRPAAGEIAPLAPDRELRVGELQGDWLQVRLDPHTVGWLRWRDENGRFLVSVPWDIGQQNR